MKTLLRSCIATLLFSFFVIQSNGQSIWTNPINNANPSTFNPFTNGQIVDANITASGIGRGSGLVAAGGANSYNATDWHSPALQWDDYFTFTLTPNNNYKINFASFVYTGQIFGAGPSSFVFKSSLDGFNTNVGTPTATGTTIDLSGASYQNITSPITFRFYGFGAGSNTGGFGINDFTFNGTVVAIAPLLTAHLVDNPTTTNIGGTINYKTTITNSGTAAAAGVAITNTAPANTSYTAGTHKTSALARDDNFATAFNTALNTGNVITNDFGFNDVGLPNVRVASFGTTASNGTTTPAGSSGTTDNSGTLTVNAIGTFTYTPPAGFSGLDKFAYVATTNVAGLANDKGIVTILVAPDITFSTINGNPPCNGAATGSITFNASGGTGTLMYSKTGANGTYQASNVFSGLASGIYNIAVKDANGNFKTGTATLTNPDPLVVSGPNIPNLTYNTAMTPIQYTQTGGAGSPSSPWGGVGFVAGVGINSATGIVSGTPTATGNNFNVIITYTDANGCYDELIIPSFAVVPKLVDDAYNVVGNTQLVADGHSTPTTPYTTSATNILTNDQSNAQIFVTAATNAATTAGGTITIASNGKFTYSPPAGFTGADSYTYSANSNSGFSTATINFTVASMVWYVNNTYAGTETGTSDKPFNTVNEAASASAINQIIYVHTGSGNTPGNALLKSGQTLRGAGSALTVGSLSIAAGTKPTLNGTVTLANSVTVDGFDMNTGAGTAITNNNVAVTGITVNIGNITTITGTGVSVTNTGNTGAMTFASVTTGAAANGITVTNFATPGTVAVNGGTITATTGIGINFSSVTAVTLGGVTINQSNQTALELFATPVTLTGSLTIATTAGGIGVRMTTGTCSIAAGSNAFSVTNTGAGPGIQSVSAGTITITGSNNTISTQTGAAFSMVGSVGAGGINFASISSNGATTGINLTNVNGPGSITIGGGTLTGALGPTFNISGGSAAVTYSGSINQATALASMVTISGGNTGTVTFNTGTLSGSNGDGLQFDNADGTYNFLGTTALSGGSNGISIFNGSGGNFNFATTSGSISITSPTGAAFLVGGTANTATINYDGNITQANNAAMVSIANHTTNPITFVAGNTLSATNGTGLQFDNADGTYNFNGTTTLNGGDAGIDIIAGTDAVAGSTGTFVFGAGTTINRANSVAGEAFNLVGSDANVTYNGSMTFGTSTGNMVFIDEHDAGIINFNTGNLTKGSSATRGIVIQNSNGGTINFNNPTISITMTTGKAINLSSNTGSTINFTPVAGGNGLDITSTTAICFDATGGGTINITGPGNTISSTTGTALNVNATTIGASGLTFQSITSNSSSANAGIVLDNTGSTGGLTVTGTGTTAGSGGTIANKTGADILSGTNPGGQTASGSGGTGIFLRNTSKPSFSYMQLNDFTNFAIYGNNITGFNLANSTINGTNGNNNAGNREESAIRFDNLTTSASFPNATITSNTISGGADGNILVYLTTGTLNRLSMTNNTFGLIGSGGGLNLAGDNVDFTVYNNATGNITCNDNQFLGTRGDFIEFSTNDNSTMDIVCRQNKFIDGQAIIPGGGTGVSVRADGGGSIIGGSINGSQTTAHCTVTFDVSCNRINGNDANAYDVVGMFFSKGNGSGTMNGTINNNIVGPPKTGSNSDGIFVRTGGGGSANILIKNNTTTGWGDAGIHLQNNDGNCTMNASLFGNSATAPGVAFPYAPLFVDNGATAADANTMNIVVGSFSTPSDQNTFAGNAGAVTDVELSNRSALTHLNLSRNGSSAATAAGIVQDDNIGTPSFDNSGGSGTTTIVNTLPATPTAVNLTCTVPL